MISIPLSDQCKTKDEFDHAGLRRLARLALDTGGCGVKFEADQPSAAELAR
jgi:hypothetical protein